MILKKKNLDKKDEPLIKFYDLIEKPVITEKATMLSNNSQVVFFVPMDTNKNVLKNTIENLFKVNVKKINIIISKGKKKGLKESKGKEKILKKQLFH